MSLKAGFTMGWLLIQAIAGVGTIVVLIDAGLSKDEPYLVKLGFFGAYVATWLFLKILDCIVWFQGPMDEISSAEHRRLVVRNG